MINTIVAYDNSDFILGNYFDESFKYIYNSTQQSNISIIEVEGERCYEAEISDLVIKMNHENFVFVGLSHGSDDGMNLYAGDNYVNANNAKLFKNSFFYSTACHIGRGLSNILLENQCKCFIGYTNIAKAPISGKYIDLFVQCELYALVQFFLTDKSIKVLFDEMKSYIDEKFLELVHGDDVIEAMALVENKDFMVLIGTEENKLLSRLNF